MKQFSCGSKLGLGSFSSCSWKQLSSVFVALSFAVLTGCSETGDDRSSMQTNQVADFSVQGSAVKGPLKNADVSLYTINYGARNLKGAEIASGTTNDRGEIQGLDVSGQFYRDAPFLLEVTNGVEQDNSTPAVPTLRTIVSPAELITLKTDGTTKGLKTYVTPITTLIVELASIVANESGPVSADSFQAALTSQTAVVKEYFGLGLLDDVAVLNTPQSPVPDSASAIVVTSRTVAYRTANEVLGALVAELMAADFSGADGDSIFKGLAEDLSDGQLDGMMGAEAVQSLAGIALEDLQRVVTLSPAELQALPIPGDGTRTIAQVNEVLGAEALSFAGATVPTLPVPTLQPISAGNDRDADGVPDAQDAFPDDPTEWADVDGDGVGDNADQCIAPGAGHTDADRDGVCDDVIDGMPVTPFDYYPNDVTRSSLADNTLPVAVITSPAADAALGTGLTVRLDASDSSDADGDPLTFSWTVTSDSNGAVIPVTNTSEVNAEGVASFRTASVTIAQAGTYTISLVANEDTNDFANDYQSSAPVEISINVEDSTKPSANAGVNRTVALGELVQLDGSDSSAPNTGGTITFSWSVEGPSGAIEVPGLEQATFTAAESGTYNVTLVVTDNSGSTDADTIVITANALPVAFAGNNRNVTYTSGANYIDLDASGTDDYEDDAEQLTYEWELISFPSSLNIPAGATVDGVGRSVGLSTANVTLLNANTANAQLVINGIEEEIRVTAPDLLLGGYIFRLTVTDTDGGVDTDEVIITLRKGDTASGGAYMAFSLAALLLLGNRRVRARLKKLIKK